MIPYRDENPTRRVPVVVITLIAINVAVFAWEMLLGDELRRAMSQYGVVPAAVLRGLDHVPILSDRGQILGYVSPLQPVWLTIFTSMFLHGGWMHLGGNMLYLWIFGDNLEDRLGPLRFLVFYFVCGVAAAGLQLLLSINSVIPMVGASGAIAGVLGGYYVSFPQARIRTVVIFFFITVVTLPASVVLGFWFLLQLWGGTRSFLPGRGGGVAFFAHIGGFVAGYLLVKALAPRGRRRRDR